MSSEFSTACSVRSNRSVSSLSSSAASRQHSTMPTYSQQHPKLEPLSIKHSSTSLELQRKSTDKVTRRSSSTLEKLTPREFLDKYSLPRVVKVVTGAEVDGDHYEVPADRDLSLLGPLAKPLLLYKEYKSTKIQARSVTSPKLVTEVGPSLVIPDSYQGWFSLVTAKGLQTAHCYTAIDQLVSARVAVFLTKNDLAAYKLNDNKDGSTISVNKRLQYVKTSVGAGQAIKLLAVFEDVNNLQHNNRRLTLSILSRGIIGAKKYAQCANHRNQMVFIPLNTSGQFYGLSSSLKDIGPEEELRMLYQVPQLLKDYRLPLRVNLISGPLPSPMPQGFTGNLLLEAYQQEDVILACTLPHEVSIRISTNQNLAFKAAVHSPEQPKFLEIDADSRFLLSRPLCHQDHESRLFKSPLLQTTLTFCRDRGEIWRRQIKVTHHIFPSHRNNPQTKPATQVKRTEEIVHKANKNKNKSRRITKKSSSFTYTSPNEVSIQKPAVQGAAISQQAAELRPDICPREAASPVTNKTRHVHLIAQKDNIQSRDLPTIAPTIEEVPYSRVADALVEITNNYKCEGDEEENIYAEICDCETNGSERHKVGFMCSKSQNKMSKKKDDYYYVQFGGGSDGTYSGTTSSSNPSSPEDEPTYDTVY